jgi:hypothetical protein
MNADELTHYYRVLEVEPGATLEEVQNARQGCVPGVISITAVGECRRRSV